LPRKSGAGKTPRVSRVDLLGKTSTGIRKCQRGTADTRTCSCGAWSESHGKNVYGRSLGRFSVRGAPQGGLCESAGFRKSRRWAALGKCIHQRDLPMRAAGKQTPAQRDLELPRLPRARTGNLETKSG